MDDSLVFSVLLDEKLRVELGVVDDEADEEAFLLIWEKARDLNAAELARNEAVVLK